MCHLFAAYLVKHKINPIQGIQILSQAIDKIRLFDTQLTFIHADLCQLSLCAKLFKPALKFLDVDITAIQNTDVSLYYFLSNFIVYKYSNFLSRFANVQAFKVFFIKLCSIKCGNFRRTKLNQSYYNEIVIIIISLKNKL